MSRALFTFVEQTPSSPGTAVSSAPVQSAASYLPGGVAGPFSEYSAIAAYFDVPLNTSGGALDVVLQTGPDDGGNWYDSIRLPTSANGAAAKTYAAPISLSTNTSTPTVIGKNGAPALAANTVVNGAFSDRCRLVFTAGSGASSSITVVVRIMAQRSDSARL
jgi:hypothetical protein